MCCVTDTVLAAQLLDFSTAEVNMTAISTQSPTSPLPSAQSAPSQSAANFQKVLNSKSTPSPANRPSNRRPLSEVEIVHRDQIMQSVITHTSYPPYVSLNDQEIIERKLWVQLKSTAEAEAQGLISAGETMLRYQVHIDEISMLIDPSNHAGGAPKVATTLRSDGSVKLTPDPRGIGYAPVEMQIAEEVVLGLNWKETDASHTAGYGMPFEARKVILGYALASIGVNSPDDLPGDWYKNKFIQKAISGLAYEGLKGSSVVLNAASYFLKNNVDYPDENTLDVPGQKNIPVAEYTDKQKIRALRHFSVDPLLMERNENKASVLQGVFNILMILDGAGMVADFFEGLAEKSISSELSEESISELAEESFPYSDDGSLAASERIATEGLEPVKTMPDGEKIYAAMSPNGDIQHFKHFRGKIFRAVDAEGQTVGPQFFTRGEEEEFFFKGGPLGGVLDGTEEVSLTAVSKDILEDPQKAAFLQFTLEGKYEEGLKFALDSMGMEFPSEYFEIVEETPGAEAITSRYKNFTDVFHGSNPVIRIPKSTLERLAKSDDGLAKLRSLVVHENNHLEFYRNGLSEVLNNSENEVLSYKSSLNQIEKDINNNYPHIPEPRSLFTEMISLDSYYEKLPKELKALHKDLYNEALALYGEDGAFYSKYAIKDGVLSSEYLDAYMKRAESIFIARGALEPGIVRSMINVYDKAIPTSLKTAESDATIQAYRDILNSLQTV